MNAAESVEELGPAEGVLSTLSKTSAVSPGADAVAVSTSAIRVAQHTPQPRLPCNDQQKKNQPEFLSATQNSLDFVLLNVYSRRSEFLSVTVAIYRE